MSAMLAYSVPMQPAGFCTANAHLLARIIHKQMSIFLMSWLVQPTEWNTSSTPASWS